MNESLNLDETMRDVLACATRMDAEYGSTVFDEWVSLRPGKEDEIYFKILNAVCAR